MINRRSILLGMAAVALPIPAKGYTFPNHPVIPLDRNVNDLYPEMIFDIESVTIKAKTRALKAIWGYEITEDII